MFFRDIILAFAIFFMAVRHSLNLTIGTLSIQEFMEEPHNLTILPKHIFNLKDLLAASTLTGHLMSSEVPCIALPG